MTFCHLATLSASSSFLTVFLRGVDADGGGRALEDGDDLGEVLPLGDLCGRLVLLVLHLAVAAGLEQHARQLPATHRRRYVQGGVAVLELKKNEIVTQTFDKTQVRHQIDEEMT